MIQLDEVSARLGETLVLDKITLSIGPEVVALVGPSGSGKTTLLRVLLGLEVPAHGRVTISNRVVSHAGCLGVLPEERNVAMVFQDLALWPHLTVRANLEFGLKARGVSKSIREKRITEVLGWVGLETKADRQPHALSGGERQRVAIARALVLEPVALLLDEPLGSLDVALKVELCELFAKLFTERHIPVVYVTHDPHEATRLGHRIVVLERGQISQQGTLADLERAPATHFVHSFMRFLQRS